jgi:SAM-dependent methyltransferase
MATSTIVGEELAEEIPEAGRGGVMAESSPWRLVTLSMLMLFVELALIRWTAANNVHLALITNFVLLASFLGIGAGFLLADRSRNLFRLSPLSLAVLVAFVLLFPVKLVALHGPHEFQGLSGHAPLSQWVSLPIIFVLVVLVMAGLGQATARTFVRFKPLDAYRLDIFGSIAGIALFSVLSFLGLPPITWGGTVAVVFVVLLGVRQRWWQWLAIVVIVVMLLLESLSAGVLWSPYYKITTSNVTSTVDGHVYHGLAVSGNNIPYQTLYSISTLHRIETFYFFPYRHVTKRALSNVLIIGAGTGNDVGVALSEGARHVDAVEIDPDLVQLGREHNPEHAYQSPRVSLHIDDGRAFLQDTSRHYSLILYALPDSLTALSGQSAPVGLENYLLTTEAIQEARDHLAPGGTFVMYNYYQPFLLDRYATALDETFGSRPCVELGNTLSGRQQAVLTVALSGHTPNCSSAWNGRQVASVSDDRPFPYLPTPSIPSLYLVVMGLILAASLVVVRVAGGPLKNMAQYMDLFFMGAAFLLLESKNIVQFALLFGTTWYVNSLVFAGVLVSVYAAVETARHVKLPRPLLLYGALLVALVVSFLVPQASLLGLPVVLRFVAATALAFAPIFIANLVFAQRFRDVAASTTAFGANLLGAILGGVLEYLSLITGFRFLLVVVAAFYGLAFAFGRRHLALRS